MAELNCSACDEIRQIDPNFVVNGFGDDECTSLQNDTGLVTTSGNDDFTDLNLMNDCLVGNMGAEIPSYDVCDWKTYMKKFVPNLWTTLKGIICAIGGIWTNIHKLWCMINYLMNGASFSIGEEATEGSYVVAGKGISFYQADPETGSHTSDVALTFVAGGLMYGTGSLIIHHSSFTDAQPCVNFDNGSTERTSTARLGNTLWGEVGRHASGGELMYEIRILKSQYPQLGKMFPGLGHEGNGSAYSVNISIFEEGQYAYGQHGTCNRTTGEADRDGYDDGHLVPEGYRYIQCRLQYQAIVMNDGVQYTPHYYMGVRMEQDEIPC